MHTQNTVGEVEARLISGCYINNKPQSNYTSTSTMGTYHIKLIHVCAVFPQAPFHKVLCMHACTPVHSINVKYAHHTRTHACTHVLNMHYKIMFCTHTSLKYYTKAMCTYYVDIHDTYLLATVSSIEYN